MGDLAQGGLQVGEGNIWFANSFNDSSWQLGTGGVGYERGSGYETLLQDRRRRRDVQHQRELLHPHSVYPGQRRLLESAAQSAVRRRLHRLSQRRRSGPPQLHGRAPVELRGQRGQSGCGRRGADDHRYLRLCGSPGTRRQSAGDPRAQWNHRQLRFPDLGRAGGGRAEPGDGLRRGRSSIPGRCR